MKKKRLYTTPEYWDCECIKNDITSKKITYGPNCNAEHHEMPDSRVNEVEVIGLTIADSSNNEFHGMG